MQFDTPEEAERRYSQFLSEARATGRVWGLQQLGGWAVYRQDDIALVPFWSAQAGADKAAQVSFIGYVSTELDLGKFIDSVLPELARRGLFVGINLRADLAGIDVDASRLAALLTAH